MGSGCPAWKPPGTGPTLSQGTEACVPWEAHLDTQLHRRPSARRQLRSHPAGADPDFVMNEPGQNGANNDFHVPAPSTLCRHQWAGGTVVTPPPPRSPRAPGPCLTDALKDQGRRWPDAGSRCRQAKQSCCTGSRTPVHLLRPDAGPREPSCREPTKPPHCRPRGDTSAWSRLSALTRARHNISCLRGDITPLPPPAWAVGSWSLGGGACCPHSSSDQASDSNPNSFLGTSAQGGLAM